MKGYQQNENEIKRKKNGKKERFGKRFYWTTFNIGYMESRHSYWDSLAQCGRINDNDTHTNE